MFTFPPTHRRYMRRKNTIEITEIYWNVLLLIFSNWCVNWKFLLGKAGLGQYKRGIPYTGMVLLTYNGQIQHCQDPGKTRQSFIKAYWDHVFATLDFPIFIVCGIFFFFLICTTLLYFAIIFYTSIFLVLKWTYGFSR